MKFLTVFQSEGQLIHITFNEMKDLLKTIMKRFIISSEVDGKSGKTLLSLKVENKSIHLQDKMEVGSKTSRLLNKLSPYDQKR